MLKLEKNGQQNQVTIIFRDKESTWTRSFAFAFLIACAIHLIFLIFFRIVPIALHFNEVILPPVRVEADPFLKVPLVTAETDHSPKYPLGLSLPSPSIPHLPDHPHFLSLSHIGFFDEKNHEGNPFANLEKEIYQTQVASLAKPSPPPIGIKISGPLAEIPILDHGATSKQLPSFSKHRMPQGEAKVIYKVLVEGRSGRIIWHEALERSQIPALNQYVEKMLPEVLFETTPDLFVIDGEIEWHFHFSRDVKDD